MKKRVCAYCNRIGHDRECRCKYKFMRLGSSAFEVQNFSSESTAAEMKKQFDKFIEHLADTNVRGGWMFSFTQYDEEKLKKNVLKLKEKADGKLPPYLRE